MRMLQNIMVALTLIAFLAGVAWLQETDSAEQRQQDLARTELHRFQQQIALQSEMPRKDQDEHPFPPTIDPKWFEGDLPRNPLLDDSHPWLEIADGADADLQHPLHRVATGSTFAKFWYNPSNGILRARVPAAISDEATLRTYNFINGCDLKAIFASSGTSN